MQGKENLRQQQQLHYHQQQQPRLWIFWGRDFGSERDQVGEEDGAKDGHTAATLA